MTPLVGVLPPLTGNCGWCGGEFPWADDPAQQKRYCSASHKTAARRRRARQRAVQIQLCLARPKPEYPDEAAAAADAAERAATPPLHPYECPRGHWHLTSAPRSGTVRRLR